MNVIDRRRFLGQVAGSSLLASGIPVAALEDSLEKRDKFGGCPAIRFEPSGFFRLEKRGRWWLVTPEGNAFLSLGMNHVHTGWLNQAHNLEHWHKVFGAERYNDAMWKAGVRAKVIRDLQAFGCNTMGMHNRYQDFHPALPVAWIKSIRFVKSDHWLEPDQMEFPDVFAPGFEVHCDLLAKREAAPLRKDPWLLGYAMTDCPVFTEIDAAARPTHTYGSARGATQTWPRVLRNLPASAPGKQAYVERMRIRHSSWILHFNEVYGTDFDSWDDLLKAENWRPETDLTNARELQDNRDFLEQVVERYYAVTTGAVRRHDPNHLFLGDKLNANTDSGDAVVHITAKYTDLIFYQMYGRWQEQRPVVARWAAKTDKPCFNGDGGFSVPQAYMPNPHGPHAVDHEHSAEMMREFCDQMFGRNDFVGWTICGWLDTHITMPKKRFKQHAGVQDAFGNHHAPLRRTLSDVSRQIYQVAAKK